MELLRADTLPGDSPPPTSNALILTIHVALIDRSCHLRLCLCPQLVHLSTGYLFLSEILSSLDLAVGSDLSCVSDASRPLIATLVDIGIREVQQGGIGILRGWLPNRVSNATALTSDGGGSSPSRA